MACRHFALWGAVEVTELPASKVRLGEVNAEKTHLYYQRILFYGNPLVTRETGLDCGEVTLSQACGLWFVSA